MPLLLALGIINVASGVYWNQKTIVEGDLEPKLWGQDARTVGVLGGLGLGMLGAMVGMPFLAMAGITVASTSFVNKNATTAVKEGLQGWIKTEADKAIAARLGPATPPAQIPSDVPPVPADPAAPAKPGAPAGGGGFLTNFANAILPKRDAVPAPS